MFQLSPWDVVSSPLAVKVELRIFSAILYDSKRNKWHRLSLQSLQASFLFPPICFSGKKNRCHCCIFIYFIFNLAKSEMYVKFLSSVYFPFLMPRTMSLCSRFVVKVSIVRDYFNSIPFNDLKPF